MRELLNGNVEFITHITPEGTQDLIVEGTGLPFLHELGSLLESLRSHLVSLLAAHLRDVGIVDGTLTEHDEECDEDKGEDRETDPVGCGTEEEVVLSTLTGVTEFDISDVLRQLLQILPREVADRGCTRTLGYIKSKALALNGLIGILRGVEIGEFHWGNLIFTLMTRYDEYIVNHGAFDAAGGEFGFVRNLRLVFVEVLRYIDDRLFQKFQITRATDDHTHGNGIVGFGFCLIELGGDGELTYSTREVSWALR